MAPTTPEVRTPVLEILGTPGHAKCFQMVKFVATSILKAGALAGHKDVLDRCPFPLTSTTATFPTFNQNAESALTFLLRGLAHRQV